MILHSGIGTYIRGILKVLTLKNDLDFTLFGDLPKIANYPCKKVLAGMPIYSLKEQMIFPRLLAQQPVDLLHVPHYNAPLGYKGKMVVTIHDLIHLKFPSSRLAYWYARAMFEAVLRKASRVIADSENTKTDILQLIGIPESKIRVIYPGVDEEFSPLPPGNQPSDPLTQEPYVLYVGNLRPTKNIETLVEAFSFARQKIPELRLLLVGKDFMPAATQKISREPGVQVVGEVNRPKLLELYRRARIFVFPSLYEGFGIPPLEAMACGVPAIVSNAASLPEVVGSAALTFDPRSSTQIADLIFGLWKDEHKRQELIAKGLEQAARFHWWKCADQIHQVYLETL